MTTLSGKSASSGIVVGRVLVLQTAPLVIKRDTVKDTAVEIRRFQNALASAKQAIRLVREHALRTLGEDKAAIFEAHIMLLEDPELIEEVEASIRNDKLNASAALQDVSRKFIGIFEAMDNEYMRERAADVRDVSDRVLRTLAGIAIPDLSTIQDEVVIVAHDLSPSETATMNPKKIVGILTNAGGKTSHTAIVARTLEIPAVLGLKRITNDCVTGDWVAFDGETGQVIVSPDDATRKQFLDRRAKYLRDKVELQALIGKPNETADGRVAQLVGNIGSPQDLGVLKKYDATGVGLYRTEFLFMEHSKMPTEEEQFVAYKTVLEALGPKPCTIRTLDIGGDKPVPYMNIPKEDNPFLGYRAIRYCLDHPEIFRTQLRALLRASAFGSLRIMFPMISSLEELLAAKEHVAAVRAELEAAKITVAPHVPVGVMIEIPSAALISDILAQNCEFLSIGTNDLIQYTVAVDRLNESVQSLYDPYHPGVLRLIQMVIEKGHEHGAKVSMCGEMGGSALHLPLLLGMGLDEFSMAPTSILRARSQLRSWTMPEAREIVKQVAKCSRSAEIEAVLIEACDRKKTERSP